MDNGDSLTQPEVAAPEPEIVSQPASAPEPEPEPEPEPTPELEAAPLPDYLTSPDAVSKDDGAQWRFGKAPNYSNTRRVWREEKKASHASGSLPELVENLVKNWEVEASFKTRLSDWRTIDHENYTFAMNGEPPQTAEHMLKCGTYNAIITPNEYYCPLHSDFASSHKTFKRMMPTFAWEVLEVYSGPPKVAFKWRHWGVMKNDYVGFNDKGEKVTAKAHGGPIEIFGVTVASVDDKVRLQNVDTYMDPLQMFRQIAPNGIVNKQPMNRKVGLTDALDPKSGPEVATTASHAQQVPLETTVEPMSSLNTCPFAPPQLIDVEPSVQQHDNISDGTANVASQIPEEINQEELQRRFDESTDAPSTENQVHNHVSNSQHHEDEIGEKGVDMETKAQAIIEEHDISNAPETQSDPVKSCHNDMHSDVQAPTIVTEHTTSNAQDTQPVLTSNTTAAEDSIPELGSGTHNGKDMDAQAQKTVEEHPAPNAQDTQPAIECKTATIEDSATSPDTGDIYSAVADTEDDTRKPTDTAELNEQQTTNDSQNAENLFQTSGALDKQTNGDLKPALMSEPHPAEDIHPHPKDVEEYVQPEAGEAVVASSGIEEAQKTHEEMSNVTPQESKQMNVE